MDDEEDYDEDGGGDYEDDEDEIGRVSTKTKGHGVDGGSEDDEGIAAWGSKKRDFYNADQIETEADAIEEEEEAKKLQRKHLQAMNEQDFGFDETEWIESGKGEDAENEPVAVTEVLPQVQITEAMSTEEKLKILKLRYPEFELLAKDFADLQPVHRELEQAVTSAKSADDNGSRPSVAVVKFRALSAYLGTVSLYFMLLASPGHDATDKPTPMPPAQLRDHPIMGSLVKFRKLWETVKDLTAPEVQDTPSSKADQKAQTKQASAKPKEKPKKANEVAKEPRQRRLSKAQRAAETAQAEAEARRAERVRDTEANLADLSNLITESGKKGKTHKTKAQPKDMEDSDFGDEDALTPKEAEEKAKQKRSLRFYTSQLAQKANKRTAAGRDAGGDTDLPYRERLKDRQARLNAEAEKRGRQRPGESEELGGDSDEEDYRTADKIRGDAGIDDDDYYDMVAARSKQRKDDKKARAEAHAAAARQGGRVEVQEEVGPDGKRAITYQIEKNKGLTPKRNKDNRNPRLKKRKKFDEKKKKLGSIRQVYKGGEGRGGYGGELTGIKKNLVKSVKF